MKLSDFDYALPKELIAQYPLKNRDAARLLVVKRKEKNIEHRTFTDITQYLLPQDTLVLNDTKVLSSRLFGSRLSGGKVELLLVRQKSGLTFECMVKPARLKPGEKIVFNGGPATAELTAKNEVTFSCKDKDEVYNLGVMPLPPYIKRKPEELDSVYYQTVYCKNSGAIAPPTAGLHFTDELLKEMQVRAMRIAYITLHTGVGTFKPVKALDITKHTMEPEYFRIPEATVKLIEEVRRERGRICAVGTTSCRALETLAAGTKEGYTDLFIYPGYDFKIVNCLLTNFHLPRTTLFMLVCAFAGEQLIQKAYREAVEQKYRFYSYGDAMLIV